MFPNADIPHSGEGCLRFMGCHQILTVNILHKCHVVPERRCVRCAVVEGMTNVDLNCPFDTAAPVRASPSTALRNPAQLCSPVPAVLAQAGRNRFTYDVYYTKAGQALRLPRRSFKSLFRCFDPIAIFDDIEDWSRRTALAGGVAGNHARKALIIFRATHGGD